MDSIPVFSPPPSLLDLSSQSPLALFLDFDGTLVEIAPAPDLITVPAYLVPRLEQLASTMEGRLALVSGRSIADLERYLGKTALAMAGSHGLERKLPGHATSGHQLEPIPAAVEAQLNVYCRDNRGVAFEHKPHGAALHFRAAPHLEEKTTQFAQAVATDNGLDLKRGKCVVELVPHGANKAAAVQSFMAQPSFSGALPVFIGDDVTDEDGFRAASSLGGFGIRVGNNETSAARYHLSSPRAVHDWLGI